jgi:hypothetical protein
MGSSRNASPYVFHLFKSDGYSLLAERLHQLFVPFAARLLLNRKPPCEGLKRLAEREVSKQMKIAPARAPGHPGIRIQLNTADQVETDVLRVRQGGFKSGKRFVIGDRQSLESDDTRRLDQLLGTERPIRRRRVGVEVNES